MAVSHIQPMGGPSPACGRDGELREEGKALMHGCRGVGVAVMEGNVALVVAALHSSHGKIKSPPLI